MLSIVLMILKIAGYILLALLALLILVLLLVLFVPIRYRAAGAKYEDISANADVSWLFHLLHVLLSFDNKKEEDKLSLVVKVLWFTVYSNLKPKEEKKEVTAAEEVLSAKEEIIAEEPEKEPVKEEKTEKDEEPVREEKPVRDEEPAREEKPSGTSGESWKDKILRKLKREKRGPSFGEKLSKSLERLQKKAEEIRIKKEHVMRIVENEKNQKWLNKVLMRLKKLLIILVPQIDRLYLHFGFKDPSATGKTLGLLSLLYPVCQDKMEILPEFETQVLEGDAAIKGHIRLVRVAAFALPSFLNPTFFKLIKQIKKI